MSEDRVRLGSRESILLHGEAVLMLMLVVVGLGNASLGDGLGGGVVNLGARAAASAGREDGTGVDGLLIFFLL